MGDGLKRARAATRATRGLAPEVPKLAEIAERIAAHLARFEADPALCEARSTTGIMCAVYQSTRAWVAGAYVGIRYVSYHSEWSLTKAQALGYLAWLDAGGVGRHWEWERAAAAKTAPLTDADMLARERARIMKERDK